MDTKSGLDKLFDAADSALGGVEGVLGPKHGATDADFREVWDRDVRWAVALSGMLGEAHHAFAGGSEVKALCGEEFRPGDLKPKVELTHGKRIVACTTCILGVSRV